MKTVLITGFEPFAGDDLNPSWEVVKLIDNKIINGYRIISKQLPTVFYESGSTLLRLIEKYKPNIVICFGLAGGSNSIRLERIAVNLNDARIPDNKGNEPCDELILRDGPVAYFTSLPIRSMQEALKNAGIPASISLSAGSFVCNHVFYRLMNRIKNSNISGGFIHLPYLDIQNKPNQFSMDIKTLIQALTIIIETTVNNQKGQQ